MPPSKVKIFDHYQYGPRSMLRRGDQFRVSGGPVCVTDDGHQVPMWERGLFTFRHYYEQGAAKWIEAHRVDSGALVVLWVGKSCRSKTITNLRRRPYRIKRVVNQQTASRRKKKGGQDKTNASTCGP